MDNIADKKYSSFLPNNFQYEFEQQEAILFETFGAQFGYYYDGTVKKIEEMFRWNIPHYFANNPNPPIGYSSGIGGITSYAQENYVQPSSLSVAPSNDYDPYEEMGEEYRGHYEFLSNAINSQHMIFLKNRVDRSKQFRQTLANSSMLNMFAAGIFDPINLIALPFGGPTIGISRSALRVGAGVAAISTVQEAFRAPTDPLNEPMESVINIGAGAIGGALFGGLLGIAPTRRFQAVQKFNNDVDDLMTNFGGLTLGEYNSLDRSMFVGVSSKTLMSRLDELNLQKQKLADEEQLLRSSIRPESGKAIIDEANYKKLKVVQKQIEDLSPELRSTQLELGLRRVDIARSRKRMAQKGDIDVDIESGVIGNSFLYKLFPSPYRRMILGKATNKVKIAFMESFSDNGFMETLSQMGIAVKNSVYSRSQTRMGDYYEILVGLQADHVNHAGKKLDKIFHYNITDTVQRLKNKRDASIPDDLLERANTPSKLTLEDYARIANYHRINKTPLSQVSESMARSIKRMDEYFVRWKDDLTEVGLLGTKKKFNEKLLVAEQQLAKLESELKINKKKLADKLGNRKLFEWVSIQEQRKVDLQKEIGILKFNSESAADDIGEDTFFPRFWDKKTIQKNRSELEKILEEHYTANPYIYKWNPKDRTWEQEQLSIDPNAIAGRAKQDVDDLLNGDDTMDFNNMYFGKGVSKHLKHRTLDISNDKVFKFIHNDPLKVMKAYQSRVAPLYEYTKYNNGKSFDDVVYELKEDMFKNGLSVKEINKIMRDYIHMYDRVVGTVVRNPDRLDFRFANTIRNLAQVSYLGHALFATVAEPAKLFHDHNWKDVFRGFATQIDAFTGDTMAKMSREEIHIAGEALDIVLQSSHLRFMDDLKANPLDNSKWDRIKDTFFMVNGLAPITTALKQIDGIVRQHSLILYSKNLVAGTATDMETRFLARYGIDLPMAIKIAQTPHEKTARGLFFANTKEWENYKTFPTIINKETNKPFEFIYSNRNELDWPKNKPNSSFIQRKTGKIFIDKEGVYEDFARKAWTEPKAKGVKPLPEDAFKTKEEYLNFIKMKEIMHAKHGTNIRSEQKISKLALAELRNQANIDQEVVTTFRTAMNSGTLNTILMGTPADKPIINDGVAYIPMSVARGFGMTEDARVKGYARIESGLMGLPFQFYSYSLAAVSKISGSFLQGQVKNRGTALLAPMILAYMGLKMRTNEYTWDKMSYEDRFARSFDYSGLASMHSALFYEALHTSMALGGPDISMGMLRPKYNVTEDGAAETVIGLGGAGPSIFWDYTTNGFTLATGKEFDYTNGVMQYINGDRGAAGKQIIRQLPFAYLPYTEGMARELGNLLDDRLD